MKPCRPVRRRFNKRCGSAATERGTRAAVVRDPIGRLRRHKAFGKRSDDKWPGAGQSRKGKPASLRSQQACRQLAFGNRSTQSTTGFRERTSWFFSCSRPRPKRSRSLRSSVARACCRVRDLLPAGLLRAVVKPILLVGRPSCASHLPEPYARTSRAVGQLLKQFADVGVLSPSRVLSLQEDDHEHQRHPILIP